MLDGAADGKMGLAEDWQDMTGGAGVLRRAGRGGGGGGGGGDHLGARQVGPSLGLICFLKEGWEYEANIFARSTQIWGSLPKSRHLWLKVYTHTHTHTHTPPPLPWRSVNNIYLTSRLL